jgi:hypothetical protein
MAHEYGEDTTGGQKASGQHYLIHSPASSFRAAFLAAMMKSKEK